MDRPAQPEEVAAAFVFFASEADSSYITGEVLTLFRVAKLLLLKGVPCARQLGSALTVAYNLILQTRCCSLL